MYLLFLGRETVKHIFRQLLEKSSLYPPGNKAQPPSLSIRWTPRLSQRILDQSLKCSCYS